MVTVELVVEMPGIFPAKNFFTSGVQNRNPTFCVPAIFPSVRLERFFDALDQIRSGLSFWWWWCLQSDNCTHLFSYIQRQTTFSGEVRPRSFKLSAPSTISPYFSAITVVPGFSVLGFRALHGFRALCTGNQIWIYVINSPGFSALPGFKAPFHGNRQSALNPGTTVSAAAWLSLKKS